MGEIILKKLTVQSFYSVESFSHTFSDRMNLIKTRDGEEILEAIRLVLNHRATQPPSRGAVREDTLIKATVIIDEESYFVTVSANGERNKLTLRAYDGIGKNVTQEYLYLCSHCAEQDRSDIFDGRERDMQAKFLKYANEDQYYLPHELSAKTDGMSDIGAFRAYLRSYIRGQEPENIRKGKKYEIFLGNDGYYGVRHRGERGKKVYLSESEQILFRYLCFLKTAEFWRGFEELRNIHGIKKPLLIGNFLERLDESIDVKDVMRRTADLERQVIIFTLTSEKRRINNLLKRKE